MNKTENILMDRDWEIDLTGRRMKYPPYPTDREYNYKDPSQEEIDEVFEISGEAVAETLIYFEEREGDTAKLVELINEHIIGEKFYISREILIDASRWWNNEFYFYFIMFCKKIIGRYDWHFGENSDKDLSIYHRLYEKGFMGKAPWGEDDNGNKVTDTVMSQVSYNLIFIEEILFLDSNEFVDWVNSLIPTKYKLNRDQYNSEAMLVSFEFFYYALELCKIIINKGHHYIFNNFYKILDKYKIVNLFINVPPTKAFESILAMNEKTSTVMNYKNVLKKGYFKTTVSTNANSDFNYFGIYKKTLLEWHSFVITACFYGFILLIFGIPPKYKYKYYFTEDGFVFEIELFWNKSKINLLLQITVALLIASCYSIVSYFLLKNHFLFNMIVSTSLSFIVPFFILFFNNYIKELKNKYDKQSKLSIEQYSNIEYVTRKLSDEKMNLEKKVTNRTAELEEANKKLKELDNYKTIFFANISHEFRTPISLILSPIECIKRGEYGNKIDKSHQIFTVIEDNGNRLLKLTNNILEWSKYELQKATPDLQSVDLNKFLTFYTTQFESSAKRKNIEFKTNFFNEKIIVDVDIAMFESVIFNILSNALKYTDKGFIKITTAINQSNAVIEVTDSGIGISECDIDKIFVPFHRIENNIKKYEGFGLGLSISKEKIELLKGTIKCTSQINKGTTFIVTLPVAESENQIELIETDVTEAEKRKYEYPYESTDKKMTNNIKIGSSSYKKKILVVEDNVDLLEHLQTILSKKYNIETASDGQKAIDLLTKSEKLPDLILSDVLMPKIDGIEFLNSVRNDLNLGSIPFIFLTGVSDPLEKLESLIIGAVDYIIKPFDISELIAKIDSLLSVMEFYKKNIVDRIIGNLDGINNVKKQIIDRPLFSLTKREIEITNYLSKGYEYKEIADYLNISISTINNHIQNIYKKLKVNNKIELLNLIIKN